jgi:hypothetical protein
LSAAAIARAVAAPGEEGRGGEGKKLRGGVGRIGGLMVVLWIWVWGTGKDTGLYRASLRQRFLLLSPPVTQTTCVVMCGFRV